MDTAEHVANKGFQLISFAGDPNRIYDPKAVLHQKYQQLFVLYLQGISRIIGALDFMHIPGMFQCSPNGKRGPNTWERT